MLSVYSLNAAKGLSFSETEDFASVELSVMIDKRVELLARPLAALACVVLPWVGAHSALALRPGACAYTAGGTMGMVER